MFAEHIQLAVVVYVLQCFGKAIVELFGPCEFRQNIRCCTAEGAMPRYIFWKGWGDKSD